MVRPQRETPPTPSTFLTIPELRSSAPPLQQTSTLQIVLTPLDQPVKPTRFTRKEQAIQTWFPSPPISASSVRFPLSVPALGCRKIQTSTASISFLLIRMERAQVPVNALVLLDQRICPDHAMMVQLLVTRLWTWRNQNSIHQTLLVISPVTRRTTRPLGRFRSDGPLQTTRDRLSRVFVTGSLICLPSRHRRVLLICVHVLPAQ